MSLRELTNASKGNDEVKKSHWKILRRLTYANMSPHVKRGKLKESDIIPDDFFNKESEQKEIVYAKVEKVGNTKRKH